MGRLLACFVFGLALVAAACAPRATPEDPDPADIVSGVGHIIYNDLEGGFYGLVADDGSRYNPINLEDAFKQDSLRVRFRAVKRPGTVTIQMWGETVEILDMLTVEVDG